MNFTSRKRTFAAKWWDEKLKVVKSHQNEITQIGGGLRATIKTSYFFKTFQASGKNSWVVATVFFFFYVHLYFGEDCRFD